jgi:hypothetical protein
MFEKENENINVIYKDLFQKKISNLTFDLNGK